LGGVTGVLLCDQWQPFAPGSSIASDCDELIAGEKQLASIEDDTLTDT